MKKTNEKTAGSALGDTAAAAAARAIQLDAGTPSAVEYLKARGVEGSVIEQVLAPEVPGQHRPKARPGAKARPAPAGDEVLDPK